MQNLSDQGRPVFRITDIGCHPSDGYFIQPKDNRELIPLDQVSMAIQMIGQEAYPIYQGSSSLVKSPPPAVGDPTSDSSEEMDSLDLWSVEFQGAYAGDPEDVCYQNAATCPDCGQGMVRLGDQCACENCGFGSCGV